MRAGNHSNREKVSMNTIEQAIRNADGPVTAKELSERFPISNAQMNRKLKKLSGRGEIERKKVGAAAVIYWDPREF